MITIVPTDPASPEAIGLLDELSATLESITGNSGRGSFNPDDVSVPRSLFVIARNDQGEAVGCGAIRPMEENVAEVKRMYAKVKGMGTGSAVLAFLECEAKAMGYVALRLETRVINREAVSFYERHGYRRIDNYGRYVGKPEAVCFEKILE